MSKIGHNEKTEQELFEEQQFMRAYIEIKGHQSKMAGVKGDIGAAQKRIKDLGFTKDDLAFAQTLEDQDVGQVIAGFERKIRIAKMFGHRLSRQLTFEDVARTPQEDRAYEEGLAAGKLRKPESSSPYQPGSREGQKWLSGHAEGHAFINKELAAVVAD